MFHRLEFTDVKGFVAELEGYIRWYNHECILLTLQCLGPLEYRAQALAA